MTARLAITLGDPAGIGPEIVAKPFALGQGTGCTVVGDPGTLRRAVEAYAPGWTVETVDAPGEDRANVVPVIPAGTLDAPVPVGEVSAEAGRAAHDAIRHAIDLARAGAVDGIVTAPIHKEALDAANVPFPGHTEMLDAYGFGEEAGRTRAERVAMMLANDELRTVLVTIHCSLRQAIERVTPEAEIKAIRLAHEGARAFGVRSPRIAVAGLNPHAGEGGLFGREEIEVIGPAIEAARAEGIDATGPWPGDTVFMQARAGRFDVVVAQYHDQGLIPVKYLGLENGVNVTLGLDFVRTSPDHGTAFDIAGRGVADSGSMVKALEVARVLVGARGQSGRRLNSSGMSLMK